MNLPSNFHVPPPSRLPPKPLPRRTWFRIQSGLGVFLFLNAKGMVIGSVLPEMAGQVRRPGGQILGGLEHLFVLLACLVAGSLGFVLGMLSGINWLSHGADRRRIERLWGAAAVKTDRSPIPRSVTFARMSVLMAAAAAWLGLLMDKSPGNARLACALATAAVAAGTYACLVRDPAGRPGSPLDAGTGIVFGLAILVPAVRWGFLH